MYLRRTMLFFTLAAAVALAEPAGLDVRFVSSIVAKAFSQQPGVSVMTSEDLRQATAFEAEKQAMGCDERSCLVEIAQAMDARIIIYGAVDALEEGLLLQINVFDARSGTSLGREVVNAPNRSALAKLAEERAGALATSTRRQAGDEALRVLILDFETRAAAAVAAEADDASLVWAGAGSAAAVGLVAVGLGAWADYQSVTTHNGVTNNPNLSRSKAEAGYGASDQWAVGAVVGYGAGALLLAGAGGLALWAALE